MVVQEPEFLKLSEDDQKASVEAIIFAAEEPISTKQLFNILIAGDFAYEENADINDEEKSEQITLEQEMKNKYEFTLETIDSLVSSINMDLFETGRPFEIVQYGGGYQFSTRREYGHLVQKFMKSKSKKRLSQAALEALAIIAYKQPISKPEIEQIRGVNSNEIVNSLMDKGFVKIAGRSESLGKPLLYATTQEFLRAFGLNSLKDLPKLRELDDIAGSDITLPDNDSEITFSVDNAKDIEDIDKAGISKIEIEKEINFNRNGH
jgi:segregation and condensation protein B